MKRDNEPKMFSAFRRLLTFLLPYWKRLVLCAMLIGIAEGLRVYFVWMTQDLLKPLMERGFQEQNCGWFLEGLKTAVRSFTPSLQPALVQLAAVCIGMVAIAFLRLVATFWHHFLAHQAGQKMIIAVRRAVFSHLQTLSLSFFEDQSTGRLLSRVTNDVAVLQSLMTVGIEEVVAVPLIMLASLVMMLYLSWKLTLIVLLICPVIGGAIYWAGLKVRRIHRDVQARLGELTSVLQESLSAVRIVQIFGTEEHEVRRFEQENKQVYRHTMRGVRVRSALMPLVEFLGIVGLCIGLWFGSKEVIFGAMKPQSLLPFIIYFHMLASSFRKVSHINTVKEQVTAAAERIFQVLDTPPDIQDAPDAVELTQPQGHIVFENVAFAYSSGREVLRKVKLEIRPKEVVALVGPSGAGKTTIASLILRLYDVTEGRVLFDGVDVRQIKLKSLRSAIGVVPQETILFEGTVRDNIAYGKPDATDEEIVEAAKKAYAHDFVSRLPEGYETWVGERGVKLSAGERQRIAIARALLRNPALLILDEATSNLDAESEAMIQKALENVTKDRTALIIAHRLSTVKQADRILVISDGGIIEEGSHEELLAGKGLYQRLYGLQLAQER